MSRLEQVARRPGRLGDPGDPGTARAPFNAGAPRGTAPARRPWAGRRRRVRSSITVRESNRSSGTGGRRRSRRRPGGPGPPRPPRAAARAAPARPGSSAGSPAPRAAAQPNRRLAVPSTRSGRTGPAPAVAQRRLGLPVAARHQPRAADEHLPRADPDLHAGHRDQSRLTGPLHRDLPARFGAPVAVDEGTAEQLPDRGAGRRRARRTAGQAQPRRGHRTDGLLAEPVVGGRHPGEHAARMLGEQPGAPR